MRLANIMLAMITVVISSVSYAETEAEPVQYLQKQWAINNYQLTGKEQKEAFISLIDKADVQVLQSPQSAELYLWRGIIKSTYAGVKGGLGALSYAKAAKLDLEKSLELDTEAMQGSAYTSLGTLYFNVPGWPIGFGDDDKAEELLKKALTINPDGIDSNYFYGDFLKNEDRYVEAKLYMEKALKAAPRIGRVIADEGRRKEIIQSIQDIKKHL